MISGGITHYCCGGPTAHPIPYDVRVGDDCASIKWKENGKPQEEIFCGNSGEYYTYARQQSAYREARDFVTDHRNLKFIDSHWQQVADTENKIQGPLPPPWYQQAVETALISIAHSAAWIWGVTH